jgi:hypothetical protein
MGPVRLVASCQQKLVFSPLLHWLLWERSWVRTHGPVSRCGVGWVGSGALLLGSSEFAQIC